MAQQQQQEPKDHWTPTAYTTSASFVPALAHKITQWLSPAPTDRLLDLGCGDGLLTAQLKPLSQSITALDASPNFITAAKQNHATTPGLSFHVHDCRYLDRWNGFAAVGFDKVFSNAAMHWILRDEGTRDGVLRDTFTMLKPGGAFVFEMGGKGNVAEVHAALMAAVVHAGVTVERARELCPWFFPSEEGMRGLLERVGFVVEKAEVEYRPTRLTEAEEGGIEGWVRLMGARFLEGVEREGRREEVVREVCEVLRTVIMREEDGSWWLGYVRLRVLARKPAS
ncbi:MAG: hypothetical protein Q9202_003070 [Teloschistes flavicans]